MFKFDGYCYQKQYDLERLKTQYQKVWFLMSDGCWRSLREISLYTGTPEASASALLRDFRKERNGSHTVERRRRGDPTRGLFEYKLILNNTKKSFDNTEKDIKL